MKIGIITCQRAYNYGAVLQAYALQTYLGNLHNDVHIIDYFPEYVHNSNGKIKNIIKSIVLFPERKKNKKCFDTFIQTFLNLTPKTYKTNEELFDIASSYDLYITGSDQVWNMNLKNGNDLSFFLNFASNTKISYAASISMDCLTDTQEEWFKDNLSEFSGISTREEKATNLLRGIGIDCQTVCDPVFLLTKKQWFDMIGHSSFTQIDEKYVLIYSLYRDGRVYDEAIKIAKKNSCKVYAVGTDLFSIKKVDKYYCSVSPMDFLILIANCDCIVTNSFHGLSFSIIFGCKACLVFPENNGNSRLLNLLNYSGVNINEVSKNPIYLENDKIDNKLSNFVAKSSTFLKRYLLDEKTDY